MIMLDQNTDNKVASAMVSVIGLLLELFPVSSPEPANYTSMASTVMPITKLESTIQNERFVKRNQGIAPRGLGRLFCIARADKSYWKNSEAVVTTEPEVVTAFSRNSFPFTVHAKLYKEMAEFYKDVPAKLLNAYVSDGEQTFKSYFELFEKAASDQDCQIYGSYREEDSIDDFGFNWKRKSFRFFLARKPPSEANSGDKTVAMSFTITLEVK